MLLLFTNEYNKFEILVLKYQHNSHRSIFRENTVKVEAFVSSSEECQMTCSGDPMCGYYKYFDKVR